METGGHVGPFVLLQSRRAIYVVIKYQGHGFWVILV